MSPQNLRFRTILPWALFALFLTLFPYLIGWLAAPEGALFTGSLVNHDDLSTYLSAMRQGANGRWLFHFTVSPEPWQDRLMLLPYILAGKLLDTTGISLLTGYHVFRLAAALFAMWAFLVWANQLFPGEARLQLTTWLFIVFGAGLSWLFTPLWNEATAAYAPDLFMPEWTPFMALFHTPHFALGVGLELLLFVCLLRAIQDGPNQWQWPLLGAFLALCLGLTYVYHIPMAGLIIGLYLLSLAVQQQSIPWRAWLAGGLILTPLPPLLFYYGGYAYRDPYFAQYARTEHIIPPPPLLGAFVGLGVVALLAIVGVRRWLQERRTWLVPLWVAGNLLALYLPVLNFTGRFALGLFVPVATLAAFGLERLILPSIQHTSFFTRFSRYTSTPAESLRRVFLFLVIPSTIILPFWTARSVTQTAGFPYYMPAGEVRAMTWLADHTDDQALYLADYPIGNFLPRLAEGKTFVGHLDHTTDLPAKLESLARFWHEDTPDSWREAFLAEWGITHIFQGQFERELMVGEVRPPGRIVYQADGVTIYQVAP
jgi:hypothetical protein